jgi:hypothetical protein
LTLEPHVSSPVEVREYRQHYYHVTPLPSGGAVLVIDDAAEIRMKDRLAVQALIDTLTLAIELTAPGEEARPLEA